MNLYLISQDVNYGFDTYDSAVVVARDEEEARNMLPYAGRAGSPEEDDKWYGGTWTTPNNVDVRQIGHALAGETGVICASFNAG